ncbi:hypothetical protein AB0H86_34335 [Streptomyces sp. NPDC050997]|uniref:hypothetical protein n=1 Tax=Streptomyces sp. NPDC050997 TaxID=3155519 RepID=UPI00342B9E87
MKPLLSSEPSTMMDDRAESPGDNDLAPLLAAWDLAHPTVADPEWRHVLDEIAHPRTTQAFHNVAGTTAT